MADDSKCQCKKLQKQLKRYESRFSDLVSSYKTIIEEKKLLEETLKTLSCKSSPASSPSPSPVRAKTVAEDVSAKSSGDPLGASSAPANTNNAGPSSADSVESDAQVALLEEKIAALSKALNSVTEGKTKMEEAFKNDRKSLIVEHTIKLQKAEEEKEAAVKREGEVRAKLCQEQMERENESKAHSLMLKELQEILAMERNEKDVLKLLLREKELAVENKQPVAENIDQAASSADDVKSVVEVVNAEEDCEEPEDETVEADQMYAAESDQAGYDRMEDTLNLQRAEEERRIAELESKISELSDVVGNYDRKRQEDQSVIRALRERLENLELENTVLQSSSQSSGTVGGERYNNLESMFQSSPLTADSAHQACQEEYRRLLEEFDQFKRKHKERISKESANEVGEYKQRMCRLERERDRLKIYHEERERANLQIIANLQVDITRSKEEQDMETDNIRRECKLTIEQMETELRKQRERTVEVIADRDKEIERLQLKILESEGEATSPVRPAPSTITEASAPLNTEESAAANEILASQTSTSDSLFYYAQQVAHYDTELYSCRMQILDMESQLRDYEKSEENLAVQMRELKEEIRSLERSKSRESANLEYLKNVCLQYILSDSSAVKVQLTNAISTVLMFSPEEMAQIRKKQKSGWWS